MWPRVTGTGEFAGQLFSSQEYLTYIPISELVYEFSLVLGGVVAGPGPILLILSGIVPFAVHLFTLTHIAV